ncbi:MAG: 2-oxoglutarate dehydrogenase E1 component [bacterium]|nr:2-oxoglutarate dehydrogenase E1 component [bacterium]
MILSGENVTVLEELYERYSQDPASVGDEWARYFRELDNGHASNGRAPAGFSAGSSASGVDHRDTAIRNLVAAYRRFGHLAADLDPLGMREQNRELLDPAFHGLTPGDMDSEFESGVPAVGRAKLRDIIAWYERSYCGHIGVEHSYLRNREEREWLENAIESEENAKPLDTGCKLRLFEKLFQAEYFEKFLAQKYVGKKRFSIEGAESLIPLLDTIIEEAGRQAIEGIVIGMAHRGRLNVLVNIMEKPAGVIFAEFEENYDPGTLDYADVKYHLGHSYARMTRSQREVYLSLAFNPSHLEAANPLVMGSVRARQKLKDDDERTKMMPLLIHGDAAFMGQGVVAEGLNLCNLDGYKVGGTFHIICNNQIGFTTLPPESRSTEYASDIAKAFQIPIFHVNADNPEAVYRSVLLAMEYRRRFQKDVIVDLIAYRRLGHNENDEPAFTQPLMYDRIKKHPTTATLYKKKLEEDADVASEDVDFIVNGSKSGLAASFDRAKEKNVTMRAETMGGRWADFSMEELDSEPQTKLLAEQLDRVYSALTELPGDFTPHPKLKRLIDNRKKMWAGDMAIDWGFAEALAFGSILENGYNIRLSGQDAKRGTFSHRHCALNDVQNGNEYIPLNAISEGQGEFEVVNSPLSEYAVLGFEFGYSLADPRSLVIWEAQFGDFANSAQIMIDQFITSSEAKWRRMSGLVMLLPHGYEGQGPEHSSARLERFLQMSSQNNIQVCNCTTPAQFFHLLRRQHLRRFRKPLVVMSPKSLLRLPEAGSSLEDLGKGVFREVLHDRNVDAKKVKRVLLCSGKVYYDLKKRRDEAKADIAIVRVEELYPFPGEDIKKVLGKFGAAKEFAWVQEEPENQGACYYIKDRLSECLPGGAQLETICRPESASPAAGLMTVHKRELEDLLQSAIGPA